MAAKFDGFSIRDYTCKMRSIDVFKCWPFTSTLNRDVTRDEVQSWLPPMTLCPRSNHHHAQNQPSTEEVSRTDVDCCSQESEKSDNSAPPPPPQAEGNDDEEEKMEMVCPVCREFNAATLTAVNAHIDGCLAQTMREERRHMRMMNLKSSKSKPPKKRSIAEIFKVDEKEEEEKEDEKQQEEEEEPQEEIESVMKLWPFREDTDDEVSSTVRKFRWLTRRLEALRSNRGGGGESVKSDEGDSVKEEKSEMVCPVCRDFNAATVTAVNAHIDGCLAQAVREERWQTRRTVSKPKPKPPKKRSIAEILTVAPPIEAAKSKSQSKAIEVEVEEDEDKSSDYEGGDSSAAAVVSIIKSKKSTNKNRKNKKAMMNKKKKMKNSKLERHCDGGVSPNNEKKTIVSKKKKKKKKKMNVFDNELTWKKEGAYERMVQTTVNNSRKLKGTIGNKMVALHDFDPSVHRKKLGLNGLSVQKKQTVKNCDSVGKQQKAVTPVHDNLKNHSKHVSGKTSSGCNNFQDGTGESHYNDQVPASDRHVKFSDKDDKLGPKMRNSFNETMFNISSDPLPTSLVKKQSSGSDEETASLEANRNYDHTAINIDRDKRKEVCPIVESKHFALEQGTVQNFLKPCTNQEKSEHLQEKSEVLTKMAVYENNNSRLLDGGNTTTLHFSSYSDISRPLSAVEEEQMSGLNTQVCESGAFSSCGKFIDHSEDPTFQVDTVNKNANTKTFLEPSSSYSVSYNKANEKPESPLQTYGDNDNSGHALGDRQLSHIFSADMIDNSFPFTSWGGKGRVRNGCSDMNFFGLPLNSHGELINFSSSGKVGMNQPDASSTSQCSLSGLPINKILHQSSQENLSINERHVVQKTFPKNGLNPFPHYSAGLAVTELQSSDREDAHGPNSDMCSGHYVHPLNSEFSKQNSFRVQNHIGNGLVSLKEGSDRISPSSSQPTMRLMGKDVPIGRSSQEMQQFAGDVWTDEESRRHYSEYTALENSLFGRCSKQDWVSGSPSQISSDNVLQSTKFQSNQGLQNTILMNGTDSVFSMKFNDLQSNQVSQNGSLGVGRNASSYFNPISQESTSYAVFNGAPEDFPEQFIPGAKPLGLNSRSQVLHTPCNFSQPTCSSNGELNDRNKNPHVAKSAFGFPFLQPSVNEHAKTSWFQRPYRSSPSWLSSSTDEMLPGTISQQFSGVSSQSFPQNLWGNNFITPSVNHSEVLFPSNPLTSRGPVKTTPLCPAPIVQPHCVPVTPSTINSGCRNINKIPDRVKLDDMISKDRHPCTNTRKRPAANIDDSRKLIKLSNMEVKENLSRMTRLTGENSSIELQRNTRAVELDPQVDSARSKCCLNEAQSLNPTSYPAVDSFKLNGMVTSGPVRLGPKRSKNILKSS